MVNKGYSMILADDINKYTSLDRYELSNILADSGYKDCSFNSVKFFGLTNSGYFCYSVKYFDNHVESEQDGNVYVKRDNNGKLIAEF
jgi:hypothetical protein